MGVIISVHYLMHIPPCLVAHHDIVHQLQLHFLTGPHLHWSRVTRAAQKTFETPP